MLVSGILEGDGCVTTGCIRLINRHLAKQVYYALQSFRIPSNYFEIKENGQLVNTVSYRDNDKRKIQYQFKGDEVRRIKKHGGCLIPGSYYSTVDFESLSKDSERQCRKKMRDNTPCFLDSVLAKGGTCNHDVWGASLEYKTTRAYKNI